MEKHPYSPNRKFNIVKMAKLPKSIFSFNAFPIRILAEFFVETNQINFKFYEIERDPEESKQIWGNKKSLRWQNSNSRFQILP